MSRSMTEEHKRKIRAANKAFGVRPWTFGNTNSKGKQRSPDSRERIRLSKLGANNPNHGKPRTEEFKTKMREIMKGRRTKPKGWHHGPEARERIRQARIQYLSSGKQKQKATDIEQLMEVGLTSRGFIFEKQVPLCNALVADFYLPEHRLVIQCDGIYWHTRAKASGRDREQNRILWFNGFNVLRFWEPDIKKSIDDCLLRIEETLDFIKQT